MKGRVVVKSEDILQSARMLGNYFAPFFQLPFETDDNPNIAIVCTPSANNFEPPCPSGREYPDPISGGVTGVGLLGGFDPVTKPEHYNSHPSGIECIQITEHLSFTIGNAVKYLWRADLKGGLEDLKKARWYLDREIAKREKCKPKTWENP